jgi:hypothetical protein
MEYNIIKCNNNCYKCNNDIECDECKEGLNDAKEFFDILLGKKKHILYKITLELDDNLVLPIKQVKNLISNKKYWWIKKNNSSRFVNYNIDFDNVKFMEIEKIEGCKKFKMELELEIGNYTIGCGTKKNGIKKDFCVKNDEYIYIK